MTGGSAVLEAADDRIVAGRAADGDTAAFAELVRRHTPLMRAYARRILGGDADVDDVVQEAFVTAWQRLDELADPGSVKAWLMRIVGRRAVDRIRSTRPSADLAELDPAAPETSSPVRAVEARAEVAALSAALRELPAEQRECWVLREVGGCSYDDIAAQLEVPASTVRGMLARARRHVIERMEEWR